MSEPFIAEIRMVAFNFPPRGWAKCDGQILPINQNQALFSLLGTAYGGDGRTTFGLPDLRGRTPMHQGLGDGLTNRTIGTRSGSETVVLSPSELPAHSHSARGTTADALSSSPAGNHLGTSAGTGRGAGPILYADPGTTPQELVDGTVGLAGGGQGHANVQPSHVVNFIIALQGLFPPRN